MAIENKTIESSDDALRWHRLALRRAELNIVKAFNILRANGIEPVLIKGWLAARNYPFDQPRLFSDIDLAVSKSDYPRADKIVHSAMLADVNVDLHNELRALDVIDWETLYLRSCLIELDGVRVRVLCPEDHLRVLATHWLTDGGQYKDRLWDIYYAIDSRPAGFDWDICLNNVSENRRQWVIMNIAITKRYLDLNVEALPFAGELDRIPAWVDRCLAKEWASEVRLRSLHTCLNDPKLFMQQVRKRIPPNPIQATVECEGRFDEGSRIPYQLRSVLSRFGPSISRVLPSIGERLWKKHKN